MKILSTTNAPAAIGPYSQGYEVNGLVYTSGQIPVDPVSGNIPEEDMETFYRVLFTLRDNFRAVTNQSENE